MVKFMVFFATVTNIFCNVQRNMRSACHPPTGLRNAFHVGSLVNELIVFLQCADWQPCTKHARRKKEKEGHQHRGTVAGRLSCNDDAKTMQRPAYAGSRVPEPAWRKCTARRVYACSMLRRVFPD